MMYRHFVYMSDTDFIFADVYGSYDFRKTIYRRELSDDEKQIFDNYYSFINNIGGKILDIEDIQIPAVMVLDVYGDFMLNQSHTTNENYHSHFQESDLLEDYKNAVINLANLIISKK